MTQPTRQDLEARTVNAQSLEREAEERLVERIAARVKAEDALAAYDDRSERLEAEAALGRALLNGPLRTQHLGQLYGPVFTIVDFAKIPRDVWDAAAKYHAPLVRSVRCAKQPNTRQEDMAALGEEMARANPMQFPSAPWCVSLTGNVPKGIWDKAVRHVEE